MMRAAGLVVGRTLQLLTERGAARDDDRGPRRDRRGGHPSEGATRPSRATRVPRDASAPRSTTRSCTASRAPDKVLREGDIISIDCGAIVDGWHGDSAITVPVGEIDPELHRADAGHRGGDVARHRRARAVGPPPVRHRPRGRDVRALSGPLRHLEEYGGHGIGTEMHMDPRVPNHGKAGHGPRLGPGMCFAVEPMVNLGTRQDRGAGRRLDRRHRSTASPRRTSSTASP